MVFMRIKTTDENIFYILHGMLKLRIQKSRAVRKNKSFEEFATSHVVFQFCGNYKLLIFYTSSYNLYKIWSEDKIGFYRQYSRCSNINRVRSPIWP